MSIKIAFQYFDEQVINRLLMTVIHPKLEYAASLWLPSRGSIRKLERVQEAVTKFVPEQRDLT